MSQIQQASQWGWVGGWAGAAHSVYVPAELFNLLRFILLFIKEGLTAPRPTLRAGPPNKDISGFFRGKARALGEAERGVWHVYTRGLSASTAPAEPERTLLSPSGHGK